MEHTMKLQPEYFYYILKGTKRIELRLFDEKRSLIKLGDTIKFLKEPNLDECFYTQVVGLLKYNSFEELIANFSISILADKNLTKKDLLNSLEKYFPKEKQKQYGVLGIVLELKQEG